MSDIELLEMAARAAGLPWDQWVVDGNDSWNSLTNGGDAIRLAVKLGIDVEFEGDKVVFADGNFSEFLGPDPCAATYRAITRAAAEMWRVAP